MVDDHLNAAAYRVLFERCDPTACQDAARAAEIEADLAKVMVWAASQPPDVNFAYRAAARTIGAEAKERARQNERSARIGAAQAAIPKPPVDLGDPT